MKLADAIDRCTDWGVTERSPIEGQSYVTTVAHPPTRFSPVALAIAHYDGNYYIVDLVRESISVKDAASILKRYNIDEVNGVFDDDDTALASAVCAAISKLRRCHER